MELGRDASWLLYKSRIVRLKRSPIESGSDES